MVHTQSQGWTGVTCSGDSEQGRSWPWAALAHAQSAETAKLWRDGSRALTPEHETGLVPHSKPTAPLPGNRGGWGHVLEGSVRLIPQHGSNLGYPPQEQRIWGVLCRVSMLPEWSWASAPLHARAVPASPSDGHRPMAGTEWASPGKTPKCQNLLLYFPKFHYSCFFIHSGRGKKTMQVVLQAINIIE